MRGQHIDPGLVVALAWWNSRRREDRTSMLRSLEDPGIPGTPAAYWEAFGRGLLCPCPYLYSAPACAGCRGPRPGAVRFLPFASASEPPG